ncbi:MAG: YfhO family protein [Candidatus Hydrogenedentota bacterium]
MDKHTNSWNRPAFILLLSFLTLLWLKVMWLNRPTEMGSDASDIYRLYMPNLQFYFDSIARGEFPLWNPYEFAGMPFVAVLEFGPFYPLSIIYALMPLGDAHLVSTGLHLLILCVGCYSFSLYTLKLHPIAAVTGAILIGASGWAMIHGLAAMDSFRAMAYLPWVLITTDYLIQKPSLKRSAALGFLLALQFLAGEAEISVRTGLILAPYALYRMWHRRTSDIVFHLFAARRIAFIFVGGVFALGLGAIQWMPTMEATRHSVREVGSLTFEQAQSGGVFTYTALFQKLTTGSDTANIFFTGTLILVLAMYSLRRRRESLIFFVVLTIVLASLMLGETSTIARLYFNLPTGDWFRWPFRYMPLLVFSLSVLAAMGMDNVIRDFSPGENPTKEKNARNWPPIIFPLFTLIFIMVWDYFLPSIENGILILPTILVLLTTAAAIKMNAPKKIFWIGPMAVVLATLLMPVWRYPTILLTPPTELDLLGLPDAIKNHPEYQANNVQRRYVDYATPQGRRIPKFGTLSQLPTINGFSVFMPAAFWKAVSPTLLDRLTPDESTEHVGVPTGLWAGLSIDNGAQEILNVLGVRYVVLGLGQELLTEGQDDTDLKRILDVAPYSLWENPDVWERAFIIPDALEVDDLNALQEKYAQGIVGVQIADARLNSVTLELPENNPSGLLVLTDQDYPGWQVTVDGSKRDITTVAGLFRGVEVKETDQQIRFVYRPISFRLGLLITVFSLIACGCVFVLSTFASKSRQPDNNSNSDVINS